MSAPLSRSAVVLLPLLSLAACGDGGGTGAPENVASVDAAPQEATVPPPAAAEAVEVPAHDLAGLSVRRVGLARFDVREVMTYGDFGEREEETGSPSALTSAGTDTTASLAFTALDEPLDEATLARIAAMPAAGASGSCYPVVDEAERSIGALFASLGTPLFAGEVVTVTRPAGSWFELHGIDDELDGPEYGMSFGPRDPYAFPELSGDVETGTTIDVPGDAFPAFTAVEVPAMSALVDVVTGDTEASWHPGTDPDVPVVLDFRFRDYVEIRPSGSGDALADDDFGVLTADDIHTLVEAPVDVRCVTPDTGRFAYPDALRTTIEEFKAAGEAVIDRLAPGSDLDTAADGDGGLTDFDGLLYDQGVSVRPSRVATRYRVEGDALLIVQSTNGGTL